MSEEYAWTFYSIISGGALVFDFFDVGIVVLFWAWRLMKEKIMLRRVHGTLLAGDYLLRKLWNLGLIGSSNPNVYAPSCT